MKRNSMILGAAAIAFGLSTYAQADVFFDATGTGNFTGVGGLPLNDFNWHQSSSLGQGARLAILNKLGLFDNVNGGNGKGNEFNLLYHARLDSYGVITNVPQPGVVNLQLPPSALPNPFPIPGFQPKEMTIVAGFTEVVTDANLGAGTASFNFVPGKLSFVEIYYDETPDADQLSGVGFSDGRLIMRAEIIATDPATFVNNGGGLGNNLDQSPNSSAASDDYPGIDTVNGNAQTQVRAVVTQFDPLFFQFDPLAQGEVNLTVVQNAGLGLPFATVDPSSGFVTDPTLAAIGAVLADRTNTNIGPDNNPAFNTVGTINGDAQFGGPDVVFQTDTNQSFTTANVQVPEPATAALGLMGLAGLALRRRREA